MKKNISRVISCLIVLVLAVSALGIVSVSASDPTIYDGVSVSESLSGTGTEADPFLIGSGADLAYFAKNPVDGASYKLTANIVWSAYVTDAEVPTASNWTPVKFNGTFDGNGHYVAGLITVDTATNGIGFFTEAYGVIKNLTIKDSYFKGKACVAGIVGIMQPNADTPTSLEIINCKNYATIDGKTDVAGIVGKAFSNAKSGQTKLNIVIKQCVNYGTIYGTDGTVYAGGIIGRGYGYGTDSGVYECINYGDIIPTNAKPAVVGGIVAQTGIKDVPGDGWNFTISDCINFGNVVGYRIVGGIIGRNYANSTVKNCVNVGNITISAPVEGDEANGYEGQFGAITGTHGGEAGVATLENCFYIEASAKNITKTDAVSLTDSLATAKAESELKSAATAALLGDKWLYNSVDGLMLVAFATAPAETPEVTTTPSEETTTEPVDETTAPTGENTTEPTEETTTEPVDETTKPVDETTTKTPENTTTPSEVTTQGKDDGKKSCGGVAVAAQVIALVCGALAFAVIKKRA